jgi:hypothetical protein
MFLIIVIWFVTHGSLAQAATKRGQSATYQFRKYNPCPSTGKFTGACPGWRMDHLESLRCGGKDVPENLWWQTVQESYAKDAQEDECWRYYQGPRK